MGVSTQSEWHWIVSCTWLGLKLKVIYSSLKGRYEIVMKKFNQVQHHTAEWGKKKCTKQGSTLHFTFPTSFLTFKLFLFSCGEENHTSTWLRVSSLIVVLHQASRWPSLALVTLCPVSPGHLSPRSSISTSRSPITSHVSMPHFLTHRKAVSQSVARARWGKASASKLDGFSWIKKRAKQSHGYNFINICMFLSCELLDFCWCCDSLQTMLSLQSTAPNTFLPGSTQAANGAQSQALEPMSLCHHNTSLSMEVQAQ